jgi:hypothetical protein
LHTGVGALHWLSFVHPVVHVLLVVLHLLLGVTVHWESSTHPTHWFVVVLQTGVGPEQFWFVVQGTQLPAPGPVRTHAGRPGVVQSELLVHGTHMPEALQTGVLPEQSLFVPHSTHLCVVSLHTGVEPVHSECS